MKDEQLPFDKKIRSALESLPEAAPPAGGWDILKNRLRDEGVLKKKKRRYFFFILITGAALSLALWFARNTFHREDISSLPENAIPAEEQTNIKDNAKSVIQPAGEEIPATENTEPSKTGDEQPIKPESVGSGNEKLPASGVPESLPDPEFKKEDIKDIPEKNENILVESKNSGNDDIPVAEKEIAIERNSINVAKSDSGDVPDEIQNDVRALRIESDVFSLASPEFMPIIPADIFSIHQKENTGVFPTATLADNASVPVPATDVIQSRWRIGIYYAWDRNRYRISENEKANEKSFYSSLDSLEIKNFQSTIGVFGGYLLNCHLEISAGVRYSQKKKFNTRYSEISDNLSDSTLFNYKYDFLGRYLQIPVQVSYIFRALNQDFYCITGINPSFNLPGKEHDYFIRTTDNPAGMRREQVNLEGRSMGISVSAGIGMKIHVHKGIAVFIEPGWQYALHPVIKHPTYDKMPVNPFINTMSIGAGAIYIFNTRQRTRPSLCL